ncbi:Rv1733c family protein [Mycolicibacterium farcinogenes]|uniref:Rv1733c family protein n=1 Tax=Mycolicibacterium farcinogenes TaxID=1802 RepID=UPI003F49A5EB
METPGFDTGRFLLTHFTFGAGRCWIVRALGANPIIRLTDRVEAVGAVLVIILILIATAITGAIGTAVHDSRSHLYAEQAASGHTVQARVMARTRAAVGTTGRQFETDARWPTPSGERSGSVVLSHPAAEGDQVEILVDPTGRQVLPPPPRWQAGVDAVSIGVAVWLVFVGVIGLAAALAQQWLMRLRYRKWDAEWRLLKSDTGGLSDTQR